MSSQSSELLFGPRAGRIGLGEEKGLLTDKVLPATSGLEKDLVAMPTASTPIRPASAGEAMA